MKNRRKQKDEPLFNAIKSVHMGNQCFGIGGGKEDAPPSSRSSRIGGHT